MILIQDSYKILLLIPTGILYDSRNWDQDLIRNPVGSDKILISFLQESCRYLKGTCIILTGFLQDPITKYYRNLTRCMKLGSRSH